ncbi:hypothetical protein AU196_08990 [Mycobacterium sp. IS-1742]|uniref:VCBS domain-containing protein n=1 Tax=Mycobacterium sp. IS-1742 TaxID=1772285 RepID=UPI0007401417|nr:VCBS domain-containing protein [Mycobacterium sp. IS-1742]KUI28517.1 hypothetical protein AU196_08990 [Mycobacterium sp. IS-1742]
MTISGIPSVLAAVAPARPHTTVLAQHIGRVGALAVALGIGVAVVASPGVAFAQPGTENSSSVGDNDTAEASPDDRDGNDIQSAEGADPDVDPDENDEDENDEDDEEPVALPGDDGEPVDPADDDDDAELEPPGDDDDGTVVDDGTTTPPPPVVVPDPPVTVTPPPSDHPPIGDSPDDPIDRGGAVTKRADDVPSPSDTTTLIVSNDEPPVSAEVADTLTLSTDADPAAFRTTANDLGEQPPTAAPVSPTHNLIALPVRIAHTVVGALLAPFLAPAGPAPANPPLLWAVLGWVHRELERTFFNRSPVLGQPGATQQDGVVVTGTITATDADGDKIAYSVAPTTAQGGTVVIDQQGRFTYVAPQTWNGVSPLTDTFTVKATDRGFHVHGLRGLFFGGGHTSTRDVTVTLAPRATGVTDTWTITAPDATSRTAVGPDGTIAIASRTGTGTVNDPYRVTVKVLRPGQDVPVESSAAGDFTFQPSIAVLTDGTVAYSTVVRSADGGVPSTTTTVMRPGEDAVALTAPGEPLGGVYSAGGTGYQMTRIATAGAPTHVRVTVVSADQPLQTYVHTGDLTTQPQIAVDGTVHYTLVEPGVAGAPSSTHLVLMRPSGIVTRDGVGLGGTAIGDDGTVAFVEWTGTGTDEDPFVTFLNVLRPGEQASRTPVAGAPGSAVVGPNGTVAYVATTGAGTALDPATTTVTVLRPGQDAIESHSTGTLFAVDAAADGTVVYSTVVLDDGSGGIFGPGSSTTTVLRPGQPEISHTAPTTNRIYPLVNATGTVLVTDVLGTGAPHDPVSTTLTIYRPGETPVVVVIPGPPVGKGLGADGTVTYAASTDSGSTFTVLRPGQSAETFTAPGGPWANPLITADGTVVHTSRESSTMAYFTIMRAGEPAVTVDTPGLVANGPVIGPDGTLYQVTDDRVLGRTNLTIVTTSGEVSRFDFAGSNPRLAIDPAGGKVVLVTSTRTGGIETLTGHEITVVTGGASSV